jgi:hypothetical protein
MGCTRSKPSQGSVPDGLAPASDFSFCFQCQVGSSLMLRRPIETARVTGRVPLGCATPPAPTFVRLPLFLGFRAGISIRRYSHVGLSKNPRRETSTC